MAVAGPAVGALVLGLVGGWALTRGGAPDPSASAAGVAPECSGETCSLHGRDGTCLRGVCVLGAGACSRDVDCDDGNPCTSERCEAGACRDGNLRGTCEASGGPGACELGFCEAPLPEACALDADCGESANSCVERACISGRCERGARPEASECSTRGGQAGQCAAGSCVASSGEPTVRCQRRWVYGYGWMPDCRRGLKFVLEPEEIAKAEAALSKRIFDELRYDMSASLVALAGGGYNLVLHNRRDRSEVQGLCDPSFVAFNIASYTAGTSWKSENLHVWLVPYAEGWGIPTRGSRTAVDKGKANSLLGAYGVVDVKTFRVWLEKSFVPLDPAAPRQAEAQFEPEVRLAALVRPVDAGVPPEVLAAAPAPAAVVVPAATKAAAAKPPRMTAAQAIAKAWSAYGAGDEDAAKRWLRQARRAGGDDPDLGELLGDPSGGRADSDAEVEEESED